MNEAVWPLCNIFGYCWQMTRLTWFGLIIGSIIVGLIWVAALKKWIK
jgi:hypothetical protein